MLSFAEPLRRVNRLLFFVFAALILLAAGLRGLAPQQTVRDMGWHLAQGQWFWDHGRPPEPDVFNYPTLGQPFIYEYPFYQLVLAAVYRMAGAPGLNLLAVLLIAAPVALILVSGERSRGKEGLTAGVLALALMLAVHRLVLRPELISYLEIVFFMVFLLHSRSDWNWKKFWPLGIAQILWVNSHSGFILGPVLVALWGLECVGRDSFAQKRVDLDGIKKWGKVLALIFLCCGLNPHGMYRLLSPFHHQTSPMIQAYVTEMQPLPWSMADPRVGLMFLGLGFLLGTAVFCRGRIAFAFLLPALAFFCGAFVNQRHLAFFAFCLPGAVVSCRSMRQSATLLFPEIVRTGALLAGITTAVVLIQVLMGPGTGLSLPEARSAYQRNETEYPVEALQWMQARQLGGRLLHRAEIGGWLQNSGIPPGSTFADTDNSKYSESQLREIALVGERPAYLKTAIAAHQPDVAILGSLSFRWPAGLRQAGWRPVFYAPFGSIWIPSDRHPGLPTLHLDEVRRLYLDWKRQNGILQIPPLLHYQNLLTLHSWGLTGLAAGELLNLPESRQRSPIFWEIAARLYFEEGAADFEGLDAFSRRADQLELRPYSVVFRACDLERTGKIQEAAALLETLPRAQKNDLAFFTLARIYHRQGRLPEAVRLLENDRLFHAYEGRRYLLLAQCFPNAPSRAAEARRKLALYAPDLL
jgi:hypothetical protein